MSDVSTAMFMSKVCLAVLCLVAMFQSARSQESHGSLGELSPPSLAGREINSRQGPSRLNFSVSVDGLRSYWTVMSFATLPKQELRVRINDGPAGGLYDVKFEGGSLKSLAHNYWQITAPEKHGFYTLKVIEQNSNEKMLVNIIVMHPWNGRDSSLNGYKIGSYQSALYRGYKTYSKPKGFIEVTKGNQDNWVSPHFQLKQFACRQTKTGNIHPDQNPVNVFPKYMLLESRLLIKLELLIQRLEEKGILIDGGMYVHSAYRTPYYNRMIGNKTLYSRHCYGDAADIFIDVDRNKMIDDLDNDGRTGDADADIMFQAAHEVLIQPWHLPLVGGVGYYKNQSYRGPFIHVDTRGYEIHWGKDKPKLPVIEGLEHLTKNLSENQRVIVESRAFYQQARKVEMKAEREAKQLQALIAQRKQALQDADKSSKIEPASLAVTGTKRPNLGPLPLLAFADEREPEPDSVSSVATSVVGSKPIPKIGWWGKVKRFFGF